MPDQIGDPILCGVIISGVLLKDGVLRVIGNNAAVELEDDSGNLSRIKTGNSQLCIEADPDNAVASTDIVLKIDIPFNCFKPNHDPLQG